MRDGTDTGGDLRNTLHDGLQRLAGFADYVIGDTFSIVPGCNKIGRLGHCKLVYDNYLRFRGFEDIPGGNKINLVGGQ